MFLELQFCMLFTVHFRYLFALQIKKDLLSGALFCQEHTAVLLASFVVQGLYMRIISQSQQ